MNTTSCMLITITLMAMFLSHPVSITMTIIMQTLITAALITIQYQTPWFSYILFLVFLGGMLVLFSYITCLTPNFVFKPNMMLMGLLPMVTIVSYFITTTSNYTNSLPQQPQPTMNKLFFQELKITLALAILLLIVLFVVVQISSTHKGPLQTKT